MIAIGNQAILTGEKIPFLDVLSKQFSVSCVALRQFAQKLFRERHLYTEIRKSTSGSQKPKIVPLMNTIWGFSDSFSTFDGGEVSLLF